MVTLERIQAIETRVEVLEKSTASLTDPLTRVLDLTGRFIAHAEAIDKRMDRMEATLNQVLEHVQGRTTY